MSENLLDLSFVLVTAPHIWHFWERFQLVAFGPSVILRYYTLFRKPRQFLAMWNILRYSLLPL